MNDQHTYTVDFSDLVGTKPQRVVSLVPSITESLFDLQLGAFVVGITDYCMHPADNVAHVEKVGGTKNPNIARIIELQPQLVFMNDEENRKEDAEALNNAGINIWATGPRSVADAINVLWNIVAIFDSTAMVPRIQHIDRVFDIVSQASGAVPRLRGFVPIWKDPWMTINQDTFIHDLIFNLGIENVFAERERRFPLAADIGDAEALPADNPDVVGRDTRYPRISLDEMVAAQPEIVILPTEPYAFTESDAETLYELDIPAATAGNIYLIEGSLITWHGTRLSQTLEAFPPLVDEARARIYPDADGDDIE